MVNVAVIDDGINFFQIGVGKNHSFSLYYDSTNQSFKLCNEAKYMNNHGTICAGIIYNYVETKEINYQDDEKAHKDFIIRPLCFAFFGGLLFLFIRERSILIRRNGKSGMEPVRILFR